MDQTTASDAAGTTLVTVVVLVAAVLFVAVYLITGYLLGRVLHKAGIPLWVGFVPVYNTWKLFQLGGFGGWWAVLAFLPLVNFAAAVVLIIAQYRIGLGFGKSGAFVLWAIFIPIVWYAWLGLDGSRWDPARAVPPPAAGYYA